MKYLTKVEMQNLSFPDSDVQKMSLDLTSKTLEMKTDSCYVNMNGGKRLFDCRIELRNWKLLEIKLYEALAGKMRVITPEDADELIDICEFVYGEEIIFKGFGFSAGQWHEYRFLGGDFSVCCLR